jgi:tetratricopeptide (TPR) repeat protein
MYEQRRNRKRRRSLGRSSSPSVLVYLCAGLCVVLLIGTAPLSTSAMTVVNRYGRIHFHGSEGRFDTFASHRRASDMQLHSVFALFVFSSQSLVFLPLRMTRKEHSELPLLDDGKTIDFYDLLDSLNPESNFTVSNSSKYQRQRQIPPTELLIRQVEQQRQAEYERVCGGVIFESVTVDTDSSSSISNGVNVPASPVNITGYMQKATVDVKGANTTESMVETRKKVPASIWSFESLFPEPVLDTESIEKDLFRTQTAPVIRGENTTTPFVASAQSTAPDSMIRNSSKQIEQKSATNTVLYGGSAVVRKERPSIVGQKSTFTASKGNVVASIQNISGKVNPLLTRMVEDRVYGYRRLPTGVLQYETSLLGPDGAVQFREGVRLGNPLPINADILSYFAKKELQHGRIEEACELYEKAVKIDPADGRAYLGLSRCAERRRDFTLARKWLIQGINRSVSLQRNKGAVVKVVDDLDSTNGFTDITATPDRGANPFLLQALGCLEEKLGRLTQAETLYAEAVKSRPYHTAAWVALAVLRTRKLGYPVSAGRYCYESAVRELQIANQPPSAFVYTSWANLEYHKGNDKNLARELFKKALLIDPQCSAAWLQLGVLEAACQNWEVAEVCFESVLKYDQRNTRVLQAYAIMETKRPSGDSRKAIGLFERAIQTNSRDSGIYQPYALYVAELGDINMARSLLQKGTQVNKRHSATWQAWGVLEGRCGDADAARNIFQEGIWACGQVTGSQSGGYHCDRLWQAWGVLEAKEEQYAAARRCFSRSLDANNRNVPAFTAWALMEEQIGNVKDARMIFERALHKFSPGSFEKMALYRSYELMEQRIGDTAAAQNVYQRSLRESFAAKNEIDLIKRIDDDSDEVSQSSTSTTTETGVGYTKKRKNYEVEVVRWENTGGEVWLNDRAIEAKVSMKKATRNGYGGSRKTNSKLNP